MQPRTHWVDVPGEGRFECLVRTGETSLNVMSEFNRLTQGADKISGMVAMACEVQAHLNVLIRTAPAGWDMDAMDWFNADDQERMSAVYGAIREADERFRKGVGTDRQAEGESAR